MALTIVAVLLQEPSPLGALGAALRVVLQNSAEAIVLGVAAGVMILLQRLRKQWDVKEKLEANPDVGREKIDQAKALQHQIVRGEIDTNQALMQTINLMASMQAQVVALALERDAMSKERTKLAQEAADALAREQAALDREAEALRKVVALEARVVELEQHMRTLQLQYSVLPGIAVQATDDSRG